MPTISVDKFLGMSDKPDGIVDNPAVAADCENVIINQGDICNIPYEQKRFVFPSGVLPDNSRMFLHYQATQSYLCFFTGLALSIIKDAHLDQPDDTFILPLETFVVLSLPGENIPLRGNYIQVGNWTFLLGLFGLYKEDRFTPYNLKFTDRKAEVDEVPSYKISEVGIHPPESVNVLTKAGTMTGQFRFGVTFVKRDSRETFSSTVLLRDNIESNMAEGPATTFTNQGAQIKLYFPRFTNPRFMLSFGYGIYAMKVNQESVFTFVKYQPFPNENPVHDPVKDQFFVKLNLSDWEQDLTRPAPITGSETAHDVPRPAFHSAYFKGRMYYASIAANVKESSNLNVKNRLEYTQLAPLSDPNIDRYVNYVKRAEFVGRDDEDITGIIEFLGQLIIFKETETWVLTDDVEVGRLRKLIHDKGCVSVNGGRGYEVVGNKLIWFALDGIYAYSGQGEPIRISDPVRKFLDQIDSTNRSLVRFSKDERYNLLYINFGSVSLIFNYVEGVWTRTSNNEAIQDSVLLKLPNSVVPAAPFLYTKQTSSIQKRGLLEHKLNRGRGGRAKVSWFWRTVKLIGGKQGRKKHWKFLRIESEDNLTNLQNRYAISGSANGTLTARGGENHLGLHDKSLQIEIGQVTNEPFRINGYELEAHIEGRR